ncbi:subtilisin-like protease SBT1.7 [Fagus crenata]
MEFKHGVYQSALPWLLLLLLGILNNAVSAVEEYQTYIIHMDHSQKPTPHLTHESWHRSILKSLSSSPAEEEELLLYSYNHVMHGFSARLTPSQLSEIQNSSAHIVTYPDSFGKLLTTYTPKLLGLKHHSGIWPAASYGEDVIVGILDKGVWPESESFHDEGMSPVPQRWKGKCENGTSFSPSNCNKKLIGARSFSKGVKHIGFDPTSYFTDPIAIGALSAVEKGVFVVCAAGNEMNLKTVDNGAPWIMTVGAATLDRSFVATMTLENGLTIEGTSYFPESVFLTNLTLYYGKGNMSKEICNDTSLDRNEVAGKVVLCDSFDSAVSQQIKEVERVGAYAAIFLTNISVALEPEKYSIPSLILADAPGTLVKEYVTRDGNPKVRSMNFVFTRFGEENAPQVAYFSSKGPNAVTPGILKPDIIAPGVDILAAYIPKKPFMKVGNHDLTTDYAFMSGTSMSTPIVAGVGALLKAVHPKWSPAAIRSALMTTAYAKDSTGRTLKPQFTGIGTPIHFGAGHIDPNRAMDPGLIYDMGFQDYVDFLCGLEYTNEQMRIILNRKKWHCNKKLSHELNYPSFIVVLSNETTYPTAMNLSRVVTNVGNDTSVYKAHLENIPTGLKIKVEPSTLTFTEKYQNQSFVVSVEIDRDFLMIIYGFLKWIDQYGHIVSSPIVAINF